MVYFVSFFKVFQRYLLFKRDHSELLYYILRQLAQDQLTFLRGRNTPELLAIEVDEKDLLEKVGRIQPWVFISFGVLLLVCCRRSKLIYMI